MKRPLLIVSAIVLGIALTNLLVEPQNTIVEKDVLEDTVETSQAADIPL